MKTQTIEQQLRIPLSPVYGGESLVNDYYRFWGAGGTLKDMCGAKPLPGIGGKHQDKVNDYNRCKAEYEKIQAEQAKADLSSQKTQDNLINQAGLTPSDTGLSTGAIVGISLGVIAAISLIGFGIYKITKKKP